MESQQVKLAFAHGFKSFNIKKNREQDELKEAMNLERPFRDLYQNIKWLNHYAFTNIMAIEQSLNEFQQEVFMVMPQYNLLVQNFEAILKKT